MTGYAKPLRATLMALLMLVVLAGAAVVGPRQDAFAEGEKITDDMKPVFAATRLFALWNHLHGDIGVANADEGHIGEDFEVNHAAGKECTFNMRERDGPIVQTISFDHLSSEYRTSRQGIYTMLHVSGQPSAVCDYKAKKCWNRLDKLLLDDGMAPHELELALRALRYIFSNVCKLAELPF